MNLNRIYVFTAMNKEGGHYFDLLRSARKYGWPLQAHYIPAEEVDDVLFSKSYNRWMNTKHLIIRGIIEEAMKKGFEKFVYVDGWDCLFTGPMEELPWYNLLHFGVEGPGAYPEEGYTEFFPKEGGINAGVIWGTCAAYMQMCPTYEGFDQLLWHRAYANSQQGYWLDLYRKVVVNLFGINAGDTWTYQGGRIGYNPTKSRPLILHANGKWSFPSFLLK